jgi:biopolymer transport protein ExbD
MSAPVGSEMKAEPNLTPLLDLVLQLVMFFMLVANFVMDQVNETIKLPIAIEAKSLDKTADAYIILNVNEQGKVLVGREVYDGMVQVRQHMKNSYELDKVRTKPADWEKGKGRSIIILRAHKDCTYKMVHDVMQACRDAGYSDIQLRALRANT